MANDAGQSSPGTASRHSAQSLSSRATWPPNLADDDLGELEGLIQLLEPQSFAAGQRIFTEGDPGDRAYVIGSGIVKISRIGAAGRINLVALAGPGDIIGELSIFDPGPRTGTVTAVNAVQAGWLDRPTLRSRIVEQPDAGRLLLQLLSRQLKRRHDQFAEQRGHSTSARVAHQILGLATRFGLEQRDGSILLPKLTEDELADLVGATAATVTPALRTLIDQAVIRIGGAALVIQDRRALRRLANASA